MFMICTCIDFCRVRENKWQNFSENHSMDIIQGGEDSWHALVCRSFFAKEPLIIGLICGKWPVKIRHPMNLYHPVPNGLLRISNGFVAPLRSTAARRARRLRTSARYQMQCVTWLSSWLWRNSVRENGFICMKQFSPSWIPKKMASWHHCAAQRRGERKFLKSQLNNCFTQQLQWRADFWEFWEFWIFFLNKLRLCWFAIW